MIVAAVLGGRVAFAQPAVDPVSPPPGTTAATLAQAAGGAPEAGPAVSPGFVVIDGFDASSRVGLQMSYLEPHQESFTRDTPTLRRFEAHARYVDKATGLGGYAQVPFAYGSGGNDLMAQAVTDLGDFELGVIFVPRLALPGVGLVLHAGVTLPTGETKAESLLGTEQNLVALPELYNSLPKATTIKLGVSPMVRKGSLFARLDLGFDWNLDSAGVDVGKGFHVNVGVGVDFGSGAVMLESENLTVTHPLETVDAMHHSVTFNALAVSARVYTGAVSPYFALVIPFEEDITANIDLAMTAGVELKIP